MTPDQAPNPKLDALAQRQGKYEIEVRRGLLEQYNANDRQPGRLAEAFSNQRYYDLDFNEDVLTWRMDITSVVCIPFLRKVLDLLTGTLYRKGPTRTLPDLPNETAALQEVYRSSGLDALMQEADRLSLLNQAAAFEVGEGDEEQPIRLTLWGAEQFHVWHDPGDWRTPEAVVTLDTVDGRKRARLYTALERVTYMGAQAATPDTPNAKKAADAYEEVDREANPYGILPFAFVHSEFPARWFWTVGLGSMLRAINRTLNYRLTLGNDDVIHNRPLGVVEGGRADTSLRRDAKAGTFQIIPAFADAGGNLQGEPRASYVTCPMDYLSSDLAQLQATLDMALQAIGVPPASIRLEQNAAASGVAIVSEQIPLSQWAESRQRPFTWFEQRIARVVCRVASVLSTVAPVFGIAAEAWYAASMAPLQVRYPSMVPNLPGPQRDQTTTFMLQNQLASRTRVLMEYHGFTDLEAQQYLETIAQELTWEESLFGPLFQQQAAQAAGVQPDGEANSGSGSPDDTGDGSADKPDEPAGD